MPVPRSSSALALSHFGDFRYNLPLPGSFHDSAKSAIVKAFYLKDMPFLVDDFHPSDEKDRRTMNAMAQWMLRAISGMGRSTLSADQTLKSVRSPRCISIMTGEDLPDVGASGVARLYIVNMRAANENTGYAGDVPKTEELTTMQEKARNGYLQASMRGYIKWLAAQADKLPGILEEDYNRLRTYAMKNAPGQHARLPGALAHIMLGYSSMLRYLRDMDVMSSEQMVTEIQDGWRVLLDAGKAQAVEMSEEKPTQRFMDLLSDLVLSGQLTMIAKEKTAHANTNMGGYKDSAYYYFLPDRAYAEVVRLSSLQGATFALGRRQLFKQMKEEGLVMADADGNPTKPVTIQGKSKRCLCIMRHLIDGEDMSRDQQTGMQIVEEQVKFDS